MARRASDAASELGVAARARTTSLRRRAQAFIEAVATAVLNDVCNQPLRDAVCDNDTALAALHRELHWLFARTAARLAAINAGLPAVAPAAIAGVGTPSFDDVSGAHPDTLFASSGLFEPAQTPTLATATITLDRWTAALSSLQADPQAESPQTPAQQLPAWTASDIGSAYEWLLSLHPHIERDNTGNSSYRLRAARRGRRTSTGAFYTPDTLVQHLLDQSLEPLIERAVASAPTADARRHAILDLRLCDPACGGGNFLLAAAKRLAHRLAARDDAHADSAFPAVVQRCIFGVDIDPLAVDLCKLALWFSCDADPQTLPHLHAHIRCGDALVGATQPLVAAGIPDHAFRPREADHRAAIAAARARNRAERRQSSVPSQPAPLTQRVADTWCAAFFARPGDGADQPVCITQSDLDRAAEAGDASLLRSNDFPSERVSALAIRHRFFHWSLAFPDVFTDARRGFDLIIGNPPFLNQLESATATARSRAAVIQTRSAGAVKRYVDEASAFLHLGVELTRPGGRIALVQPQSVLAAADARPLRRALLEHAAPRSVWIAGNHLFADASVYTCAIVLEREAPPHGTLTRTVGPAFDSLPPLPIDTSELANRDSWSELVASAFGLPEISIPTRKTVGDFATATADFRDQYYGLDGFIVEHDQLPPDQRDNWCDFPAIITSGLIDLAACHWSLRPTRLLRQTWTAPRVDRIRMNRQGSLGPWITQRLVPKILLASQTRVIEIIVDEHGRLLPSVPVVTVVPKDPAHIWLVAAALASPVATLSAMRRYAGAALHHDAIKLSARQVLALPAAETLSSLHAAATHLRAAHAATDPQERTRLLKSFADTAVEAAGGTDSATLLNWWSSRLAPIREP